MGFVSITPFIMTPMAAPGTMPDQNVASDPSVNTATLKSNEFNYNGRVFTGWNTKRDGTGTAYKENTSYAKLNITAREPNNHLVCAMDYRQS